MKNLVSTLALLAMLFIASSGYSVSEAYLTAGDKAPGIELSNDSTKLNLDDLKGDYVLLTFWSSSDAQSRVDCNAYSAWFAKCKPENVKHISVNLDSEPTLFDEIVRLDNLDKETQFNACGDDAGRIIELYCLQEGLGSVLIGPDGRICEFNPTTSDLSSL